MSTLALKQARKIYSISEVINEVNDIFEDEYNNVWLRGEVSNFTEAFSGHYYFKIKDENAQISAVMFKGFNRTLKFNMGNGLGIIVHGKLSIFKSQGNFQIQVNYAEPDGIGALQLAFEQLKTKLEKEGLFDQSLKKNIPLLPKTIGVVTSLKGAAVHDIISISQRRFPNIHIIVYPVSVQGNTSAKEIAAAINYFSKKGNVDTLIVGRGGGSTEDLWSFNEEIVARAIFHCKVPVVSAVGHETDFTISDFVADLRAPTPSAAAEHCVPVKLDLIQKVSQHRKSLIAAVNDDLQEKTKDIKLLLNELRTPNLILDQQILKTSDLESRLVQSMNGLLNENKHSTDKLMIKLKLLSPKNILKRGYIIGKNSLGKVITRKSSAKTGDLLDLTFHDGEVRTRVE